MGTRSHVVGWGDAFLWCLLPRNFCHVGLQAAEYDRGFVLSTVFVATGSARSSPGAEAEVSPCRVTCSTTYLCVQQMLVPGWPHSCWEGTSRTEAVSALSGYLIWKAELTFLWPQWGG